MTPTHPSTSVRIRGSSERGLSRPAFARDAFHRVPELASRTPPLGRDPFHRVPILSRSPRSIFASPSGSHIALYPMNTRIHPGVHRPALHYKRFHRFPPQLSSRHACALDTAKPTAPPPNRLLTHRSDLVSSHQQTRHASAPRSTRNPGGFFVFSDRRAAP